MTEAREQIGFIKYESNRLETGAYDARKSARALIGLDEALRHFISIQVPELRTIDFEIPVKIEKGSWIASIPTDIATLFQLGIGVVVTAYGTKAAQKMAEKDFDDIGIKDAFKKSFEALRWIIKIGKHLGGLTQRRFEQVKFQDNNELIGIPNDKGEHLFVPRVYLELYATASPRILDKLASNVDSTTVLTIGSAANGVISKESITEKEKSIFTSDELDSTSDVLFPQLIHGEYVELDGEVTRENKTSNSMGFKYQGHILSAYPDTGNIVPFKAMLFDRCRLIGYVDRIDEKGKVGAKRPKLIFSHLLPLRDEGKDLFNQ